MEFSETRDGLWVARRDTNFAGSVAIDGRNARTDGARLRWLIVVPEFQGLGIGKVLVARAVEFCRTQGYPNVYLWTFEGLDTARFLYEDQDLIVLNKQPGLVVHPAPGHYSGTLVNALLYHRPGICCVGEKLRPGIVHRLDKDTSGALVVAKNTAAYAYLTAQFKSRKVQKTYLALVYGEMRTDAGVISAPIGRHPVHRKRMSTQSRKSRPAKTHWKVKDRFESLTLLELNLKTGRTHQIRVHCATINHPIVGDSVYSGRKSKRNLPKPVAAIVKAAPRQMLHAWRLGLSHPTSKNMITFEAPLPPDFTEITKGLSHHRRLD